MAILARSVSRNWIAAAIVPFVVQSLILTADRNGSLQQLSPWRDAPSFALVTLGVSTASGFAFLFRPFRARLVVVAVAYFPLMAIALFLFSFAFGAAVLGQRP